MNAIIVADAKGYLVAYESFSDSEPQVHVLFWRVVAHRSNGYGGHIEDGAAVTYDGGVWSGRGFSCSTNNDAERVEIVDVPAPKVRGNKPVRWYRGRWEKLMAKGWVSA